MTFSAVKKSIYYANQLSSMFAEECTFLPGNGDPERRIWAAFTKRQRIEAQEATEDYKAEFEVRVGRDPTHEKGGVVNFMDNDAFVRDRSDSSPVEHYLEFTGEILEEFDHYIKAVFRRTIRVSQGRRR